MRAARRPAGATWERPCRRSRSVIKREKYQSQPGSSYQRKMEEIVSMICTKTLFPARRLPTYGDFFACSAGHACMPLCSEAHAILCAAPSKQESPTRISISTWQATKWCARLVRLRTAVPQPVLASSQLKVSQVEEAIGTCWCTTNRTSSGAFAGSRVLPRSVLRYDETSNLARRLMSGEQHDCVTLYSNFRPYP